MGSSDFSEDVSQLEPQLSKAMAALHVLLGPKGGGGDLFLSRLKGFGKWYVVAPKPNTKYKICAKNIMCITCSMLVGFFTNMPPGRM